MNTTCFIGGSDASSEFFWEWVFCLCLSNLSLKESRDLISFQALEEEVQFMQQSSHRPGEAGLGITACRVGSRILRKIAGKFFPPLRSTFFPSSVEVPRCPTMGSSLLGKEGFSKSLPLFQIASDPPPPNLPSPSGRV